MAGMLIFDIETTGLKSDAQVTIVCTQDFRTGKRRDYEFGRGLACGAQNWGLLRKELIEAFNAAESLCAFNGVRFDIPFLKRALALKQETTASWLSKTTDILEAARRGTFGPAHTFPLSMLCQHNNIANKSGSAEQAKQWAREGQWDALLSYCAEDVRILCDLYKRRFLNNPRFYHVIDLRAITCAGMYEDDKPRASARFPPGATAEAPAEESDEKWRRVCPHNKLQFQCKLCRALSDNDPVVIDLDTEDSEQGGGGSGEGAGGKRIKVEAVEEPQRLKQRHLGGIWKPDKNGVLRIALHLGNQELQTREGLAGGAGAAGGATNADATAEM